MTTVNAQVTALAISAAIRVFTYNGTEMPDPGTHFTVEQVKDTYAAVYPELNNATIEGPVVKADKLVYAFTRTEGAKG
ncbi:PRTRC system protein C [Undibacterium arcticum]|uniref:PRTRC system protein C n=1 Tax=Undibacterium arcticum TaxID=1762892 RepID=A0ABV7FC29_9BURK